jgi:cysteine desulfurase
VTYFDHNATSPLHPAARQAWLDASEKFIGNPSSPHRVGARADAALNEARETLASFLGCHALDIVWTSGATESANMALHHFARSLDPEKEVWLSAIEHPCVLEATRHQFPKRHRLIPVTRDGVVDLNWLERTLAKTKKRPGAVIVMAANNETGVLQPWSGVLKLCRERRVPFFCDATQWVGKLTAAGLGEIDFVSGSAHKFGGPKGVGFLKCPAKGRVQPLLFGGQQEEGRRAGTENVPGVLAMIAALEVREAAMQSGAPNTGRDDFHVVPQNQGRRGTRPSHNLLSAEALTTAHSMELQLRIHWRDAFTERLLKSLPGAEIVSANSPQLWNTVSALMPEAGCQSRWVVKLDKLGFAVSTGSACASGKEAPSHVLTAMGYSAADAGRVLRFSSGWETTETEWNTLAEALAKLGQGMRATGKS